MRHTIQIKSLLYLHLRTSCGKKCMGFNHHSNPTTGIDIVQGPLPQFFFLRSSIHTQKCIKNLSNQLENQTEAKPGLCWKTIPPRRWKISRWIRRRSCRLDGGDSGWGGVLDGDRPPKNKGGENFSFRRMRTKTMEQSPVYSLLTHLFLR